MALSDLASTDREVLLAAMQRLKAEKERTRDKSGVYVSPFGNRYLWEPCGSRPYYGPWMGCP